MLTSDQIRAARALLRWPAQKLADQAKLGISTIQRMEAASGVPVASARNLDKVQRVLEAAGAVFIDENGGGPGVRLRSASGVQRVERLSD